MSELITTRPRADIRWHFLATASALVLLSYVSSNGPAEAEDSEHPTVWIELGGQLSRWENSQEIYFPPFVALTPSEFSPPQKAERPPRYGMDESAALIFQPEGSDWTFSASIRYGRSSNAKHVRQQSNPTYYTNYSRFHQTYTTGYVRQHTGHVKFAPIAGRFADAATKQSESHTILDFQAGKDLGIGLFGRASSSSVNAGLRFAQFTSKSSVALKENPDWQFKTQITTFSTATYYGGSFGRTNQNVHQPYHSFAGTFRASRSFAGLGPSISWKSSEQFVGSPEHGALTFDWGVDASLLFGRQKAEIHHQSTALFHSTYAGPVNKTTVYQNLPPDHRRSRSVVVPNIGAFAGLSFNYPNAKVSFGYKADFFFGAMDGGIDVRRTEDVGFHGPFATVSIGLGG